MLKEAYESVVEIPSTIACALVGGEYSDSALPIASFHKKVMYFLSLFAYSADRIGGKTDVQ